MSAVFCGKKQKNISLNTFLTINSNRYLDRQRRSRRDDKMISTIKSLVSGVVSSVKKPLGMAKGTKTVKAKKARKCKCC